MAIVVPDIGRGCVVSSFAGDAETGLKIGWSLRALSAIHTAKIIRYLLWFACHERLSALG
jgi:hypothetical protein